jgi:hypothetical protein
MKTLTFKKIIALIENSIYSLYGVNTYTVPDKKKRRAGNRNIPAPIGNGVNLS